MAIPHAGGTSSKNKKQWAYIPKKTRTKPGGKGPGHTVTVWGGGWVKIGSSQWQSLKGKGLSPTKYAKHKPGTAINRQSPDTRDAGKGRKNPVGTWVKMAKNGNARAAKNLQRWLRSQGYKINVDGKWGPQTSAAYKAYLGGNKYGSTNPKPRPKGSPVTRFNAGPRANRKQKAVKGKVARQRETQKAIGQQLGGTSTGKKLGPDYAGALAGMQFDAPINDLKVLIERLGPQNKQAIADIEQWYGTVNQLNDTAGARAGAIAEDVAGKQDQAIIGLMAALGGGGNDANAALAETNLRDTGLLRALGGIEQQYHADADPIIAHASASAKTLEQRRNLQQMQDYQLQLAQLMGQRGQAKAGHQMEVDQYNNQLAQQFFQNKLAKLNATLGAQAAGVDMQAKRAAIKAQQKAGGQGGFIPWKQLNAGEKTQLLSAAAFLPNGRKRSFAKARQYLTGLGYSNSSLLTALRGFYK